jgi:3-oxoacyl-[acyl-carrier protein] reductase/meso-butanediol dehydrogenase/(S,S)-butanediol dehydrogenase/diacetyl reductase
MQGLSGKVALVTGAARWRGIGRAIALRLAEEGCNVVVCGLPRDPSTFPAHEQEMGWRGVSSLAEEIEAGGSGALGVDCDVTDRAQVEAMVGAALHRFGRLDILVNNAALPSEAGAAPILDVADEVWYRTVDVNLNGLFLVTQVGGRAIRDGGRGGCIVNISSMAGRQGLPNYGAYCATKWGMIGLTQQLAIELAPHGIRVNCVCPGSTDTDMMDGTFGRTAARFSIDREQARRGAVARIPMGRQGRVEEQAAAVAFLASDDATYITGQTLNVDGGLRMD